MSTFQRAREALGLRLRELRRDAHLTGRRLAELNGWHPSKVSKVENGKQNPTETDLRSWAAACERPDLADEFIASLRTLETHYVTYRRMFRSGLTAKQRAWADLEEGTRFVRNFEAAVIPGLLQTPGYARSRLMEGITYDGSPDDLDDAVAARMQRQQVLYRSGRRFHFVITEAVLRYGLCSPEVMAGQLDRLVALSTAPGLRFGVIPFTEPLAKAPLHGFWIFDDARSWSRTSPPNSTSPNRPRCSATCGSSVVWPRTPATAARRAPSSHGS
nr:helix-turn-helix transcriptional regulator [Nocardiopsis sp. CNR-923]